MLAFFRRARPSQSGAVATSCSAKMNAFWKPPSVWTVMFSSFLTPSPRSFAPARGYAPIFRISRGSGGAGALPDVPLEAPVRAHLF